MSILERAADKSGVELDGNRLKIGQSRVRDYSNLIKAIRELEGAEQALEIQHQRRYEECAEELNKAQKRIHELEQMLLKQELDQRLRKVNVPENDREYVLGATGAPGAPRLEEQPAGS